MPTVFLAFANSLANPLPSLKRECDELNTILIPDAQRNKYTLLCEQYATPQIINTRFAQLGNDIAIFHYSGHATVNTLLLNDQDVNAAGLANLLQLAAANKTLKLVILNGCSTSEQVKLLLDLGVPAVIATHAPVGDNSACEFAIHFFRYLSGDVMNIRRAFRNALPYALNAGNQAIDVQGQEPRGVDYITQLAPGQPLWEIFYTELTAININPLPKVRNEAYDGGNVNTTLRDSLCKALGIDKAKFPFQVNVDQAIVEGFPTPIGEHIRVLLTSEFADADEKRVRQLCRLYFVSIEFLSYVMIAQLWDYLAKADKPTIDAYRITRLPGILRTHFELPINKRNEFDYPEFLLELMDYFNTQKTLNPFIDEFDKLKEILKLESPFSQACEHFAELSSRCNENEIDSAEVVDLCIKAEQWAADIFSQLGFLQRYDLTSIQAISVVKYRHLPRTSFKHIVIKLMRTNNRERFFYTLDDCLDCEGVILLKDGVQQIANVYVQKGDLKFLNLSPFLIDISAFESGNIVRIGVLGEYSKSSGTYIFKDLSKPDSARDTTDIKKGGSFERVKTELDYYRSNILGIPEQV